MNKPFDPWTATEEEAKTAEQRFQMNVAQYVIDYREEYVLESWSELRLLETISWILKAGLKAPQRLSEEFYRRLQPILTGKQDFSEWKAGSTPTQRQSAEKRFDVWVYHLAEKCLKENPGKYVKGVSRTIHKENVFEAIEDSVTEKTGEVWESSALRDAYYRIHDILQNKQKARSKNTATKKRPSAKKAAKKATGRKPAKKA